MSDGTSAGTGQLIAGVLALLYPNGAQAYFRSFDTTGVGNLAPG